MRDELHRYLDGEFPPEELPEELRREAAAWDGFLEEVRGIGPAGAPAGLEAEVMRAVLAAESGPWWKRAGDWWLRPRSVRISPLGAGLAAAAVLAVALALPFGGPRPDAESSVASGRTAGGGAPSAVEGPLAAGSEGGSLATGSEGGSPADFVTQTVYVKFLLEAPAARSVSLAGNFNSWSPDIPLQDPDGDGVWTATVPMKPGVHEYMFVVDGSNWVTDPYAGRYEEDGFGNRNAVLAIAGPSGT